MLLAYVDRRQLGLWHGCSVIHKHHHRVDVNVVVILWWCGWSPKLCWKITSQNIARKQNGTRCASKHMTVISKRIGKKFYTIPHVIQGFVYKIKDKVEIHILLLEPTQNIIHNMQNLWCPTGMISVWPSSASNTYSC